MGAQGTAVLDFGAFPGATDASVVITGQSGILAGSLVEAWLLPADTGSAGTPTFHSADEHMLVRMNVFARNIVAGTGFSIFGALADDTVEPQLPSKGTTGGLAGSLSAPQLTQQPTAGGIGRTIWGTWNVAWVWN